MITIMMIIIMKKKKMTITKKLKLLHFDNYVAGN